MRRRILQSILAVVIMTALLLGVPLIYTAWLWVEDVTRSDLRVRLDRMAAEVIAQEGTNGLVEGALNTDSLKVLTPNDGRLVVVYPTVVDGAARVDVGEATVKNALVESLAMGTSGSLRLEVPSGEPAHPAETSGDGCRRARASVHHGRHRGSCGHCASACRSAAGCGRPGGAPRRRRLPAGSSSARHPRTRPRVRRPRCGNRGDLRAAATRARAGCGRLASTAQSTDCSAAAPGRVVRSRRS